MSDTKWTAEQLDAIDEKGCNLLVAAAAGAGKTAVLVERIVRKITDDNDPVDIDRLLIVTFTNAAATEMRERIEEAVSSALEKNPGSKNIQRQLTLLNKASITTIHSFCLEVIRGNFQKIDIDPGFRIADETEALLLKLEALNELFEEQYENESENGDFYELLECYGGNRDDQALQDMVLDLYGFIQSSPWPEEWLDEMTERFNAAGIGDFGGTEWGRVLIDSVLLELEGMRNMISSALETARQARGLEKYCGVLEEDLLNLEALAGKKSGSTPGLQMGHGTCPLAPFADANLEALAGNHAGSSCGAMLWDDLYNGFRNLDFSRLPIADRDCDREKQEIVRKIRDDVKSRIRKLQESVFNAGSSDVSKDLEYLYPLMKCLTRLVTEFGKKYAEKKRLKSLVDFNDLEHYCLAVLSDRDEKGGLKPSEAALEYRERFSEILVDEYQDSNLVQESMIRLISQVDDGKPNIFMVGDVKQSIYRFRQARPELFLDKYRTYSPEKGRSFRKILLYRNFRSRREVVDAVNFIFRQIMSAQAGELDYSDVEALNPGASFEENTDASAVVGGETELHLIQIDGRDEASDESSGNGSEQEEENVEPDDEEMLDRVQCEARLVARRIRELVSHDGQNRRFKVYDRSKKLYRTVEYSDIVILLRTMSNWSDIFMEELARLGIPAFADTGTGFFKTVEIQVMLSLLQIIDNPLQDIPLLSVLRSPIGAFTPDELADIRLADRKALLFDALQKLAGRQDGEVSKKAAAFVRRLDSWRDVSLYMSTDRLIWQLYDDTGYYGMVGAMPAGAQRQANLRMLFERARQYEETSFKGLFNFISFIDKLKSSRGDMGSAKILGENDNVVRIMSIHKSKGLEFPVVILAGCSKKFNFQDMNKSILLHQELGFGPDVSDYRTRLSYPSAPKQAIREKIKTETLSEEMRILYVALTRAREKLIITGTVNDMQKAGAKWARCAGVKDRKLQAFDVLKGTRYMDWIGPALLRHKDGGFRELAGTGDEFGGFLIDDPSRWKFRLWYRNDIAGASDDEIKDEKVFTCWMDSLEALPEGSELHKEVAIRLNWKYPYRNASRVPAKVSVTELKRRFDAMFSEDAQVIPQTLPVLVKKPKFLEEKKGLSAAEAGTVLHFVMQHLDFFNGDIEGQIAEMTRKELITEQQAAVADTGKIRRFISSRLGARMLASGRISREMPFNMEIPCSELFTDMADAEYGGETMLLQGVIDCFFEEHDGLVLLDYKTDYVPAGGTEQIRERYRTQIGYYSRALELLTGKHVKDRYVYLFWNGETLEY